MSASFTRVKSRRESTLDGCYALDAKSYVQQSSTIYALVPNDVTLSIHDLVGRRVGPTKESKNDKMAQARMQHT